MLISFIIISHIDVCVKTLCCPCRSCLCASYVSRLHPVGNSISGRHSLLVQGGRHHCVWANRVLQIGANCNLCCLGARLHQAPAWLQVCQMLNLRHWHDDCMHINELWGPSSVHTEAMNCLQICWVLHAVSTTHLRPAHTGPAGLALRHWVATSTWLLCRDCCMLIMRLHVLCGYGFWQCSALLGWITGPATRQVIDSTLQAGS